MFILIKSVRTKRTSVTITKKCCTVSDSVSDNRGGNNIISVRMRTSTGNSVLGDRVIDNQYKSALCSCCRIIDNQGEEDSVSPKNNTLFYQSEQCEQFFANSVSGHIR